MKVGVVVPMTGDDREPNPSYAKVRSFALAAEEAGLDSIWVFDHLVLRFPERPPTPILECWTTLSALAEATERVELGTLVLGVPFRNPAVLAKSAVTLDDVSGGRLTLGLGAGWHEPEFAEFGIPFDHLASRFEEALRIIVPLVKEGAVDFTGEYHAAPNCELLPRSNRPGGIPILVAGAKPRMLRLTAEYADAWNAAWFGHVEHALPRLGALAPVLQAAGKEPGAVETTAGVSVAFPEPGTTDGEPPNPAKVLSGTVEEVAAGLRGYGEAGVAHVMCNLEPRDESSVAKLGAAAGMARG